MKIRPMLTTDIEGIKIIYENQYASEFEFPDFTKFLSVFVIENNDGQIIVAGGIKPIIESVIITDKTFNTMERVKALHKALDISEYISRVQGIDQIHAFITDENWYRQLESNGFVPTRGKPLVLNL